jgi:hypothetical protein
MTTEEPSTTPHTVTKRASNQIGGMATTQLRTPRASKHRQLYSTVPTIVDVAIDTRVRVLTSGHTITEGITGGTVPPSTGKGEPGVLPLACILTPRR